MRTTAAPRRWPYREHRTLAEIGRAEKQMTRASLGFELEDNPTITDRMHRDDMRRANDRFLAALNAARNPINSPESPHIALALGNPATEARFPASASVANPHHNLSGDHSDSDRFHSASSFHEGSSAGA